MWMTINSDVKDDKIILNCNKDGKTLKNYFELIPDEYIKIDDGKE